jgi:integrase
MSVVMGVLYRRTVRMCTTCRRRLDTTAARRGCEAAGHVIQLVETPTWWIRYQVDGREQRVSARSADRSVAESLLHTLAGDHAVREVVGQTARSVVGDFNSAADALIAEYALNGRRSLRTLTLRLRKHLRPVFGSLALTAITTSRVRVFMEQRHSAGASNATINRDLITLKRVLSLAVQDGTLDRKPYIPLLKEHNIRRGFFEREEFERIQAQLPADMQGVAAFAFVTGWRTPSEILRLEWRHVDFDLREVRLDPGTTKNGEGRVFPFTAALAQVLEAQRTGAATLAARGVPSRHVFCYTQGPRVGHPIGATNYIHRWWAARRAAGCPTRIPHDFRRTAVRNLVRAGVPERVAMQLTGHKTRAIFERYNVVSPGDLQDAARRLDRFAASMS